MEREVDSALAWVEEQIGGPIVRREEQRRWRPQHFLDVETDEGRVIPLLLRGWRAPGVVDSEEGSRRRLKREAAILKALDTLPVRSPRYYGYCEAGDWLLMERVTGDDLLTDVDDPNRQRTLFCQYIEDVARIHQADPETLGLPETIYRPADAETNASWNYKGNREVFLAAGCDPDPLFELAWAWLDGHRPAPPERYSLCTGDIGANQFLFEGDTYKCMFDVEMGYVGDPVQDLGMMRYRNTCYPVRDFEAVLRHYYRASGRTFDRDSLNYWTVVGLMGAGPLFAPLRARPDPAKPMDMSLIWGMQGRRRGLISALCQIHDLETPERPASPPETDDHRDSYYAYLPASIGAFYRPAAGEEEAHHLRFIEAHSKVALRCARSGAAMAAANLDDYASMLGARPASEAEGVRRLADAIRADPEKDIERRLAAMYRIECREEYLLEPVIHAVGFASFAPLDEMGRKTVAD